MEAADDDGRKDKNLGENSANLSQHNLQVQKKMEAAADDDGRKDKNLGENSEKKGNVGFSDEALKKCLELKKKKGENSAIDTCNSVIEAFKKSSSSSSSSSSKPLTPFILKRGTLTDV